MITKDKKLKQPQTKELINQLNEAFSALIKHLWSKHRPSKSFLISSFLWLAFLFMYALVIAALVVVIIKYDPDVTGLIPSTDQEPTGSSKPSDFLTIVSSIGSLLAGLGTVGLLIFGWVTSKNWMSQIKTDKYTSLKLKTAESCYSEARQLFNLVMNQLLFGEHNENFKYKVEDIQKFTYQSSLMYAISTLLKNLKWSQENSMLSTIQRLEEQLDKNLKAIADYPKTNPSRKKIQESCEEITKTAESILKIAITELH